MSECHKQVEEALRATIFLSPTTYSWFGKPSWPLSPKVKSMLTPHIARSYLLFMLQQQLYNNFYCPGTAIPADQRLIAKLVTGSSPFVEALAVANAGSGYWDEGWQIRSLEESGVVIRKEALELWVQQAHCRISQDGQITPERRLSLRFPKDSYSISPGFYIALGNRPLMGTSQELVRFYWNLVPEGAVPLMHIATTLLNQADLPFNLKVLNDPEQFTRCDAAVLYILKSDYAAAATLLPTIYAAVETHLKQPIPAFTKRLGPGLGLAEDPESGQKGSFGDHRCRLLAEGMIRAYEQGKKSLTERLRVVEHCFAEAGIALEQPFLNPGSRDVYSFQFQRELKIEPGKEVESGQVSPVLSSPPPSYSTSIYLQTAYAIGQQLVQEAIWHDEQCNWLGTGLSSSHSTRGTATQIAYRALGTELYNGTSGIALFLAQLAAMTKDITLRRTALGGIRQALRHLDTIPPSDRLGLYGGWIGIALAAARIGTLLGEEEWLDQAAQLLLRTQREQPEQHEFDIIYGNAGAIVALLTLHDILRYTSLLDFAVQLGDELLHSADRSERGCSWRSFALLTHHNLVGFSHGTAGIAYALLELFQKTGDAKYRSVAEAALDYEQHWFDADKGNWPDFRRNAHETRYNKRSKQPFTAVTFWCHGAPGVALSRLRAYDILNEECYKTEAMTALYTTQKAVETALHTGMDNFSLCHGLSGNADILLEGHRTLGQEWSHGAFLAEKVATFGIDTYAALGKQWPCGISGGSTAGLFLGLAGIGYFYLRMYSPSTPSILLAQLERLVAHP